MEADDEITAMRESRAREIGEWRRDVLLCLALTITLLLIKIISAGSSTEVAGASTNNASTINAEIATGLFSDLTIAWIMWFLATPIQFFVGKRFYVKAWYGIRAGCSLGMDFLVASGTSCSYGYSVISVLVRSLFFVCAKSFLWCSLCD